MSLRLWRIGAEETPAVGQTPSRIKQVYICVIMLTIAPHEPTEMLPEIEVDFGHVCLL